VSQGLRKFAVRASTTLVGAVIVATLVLWMPKPVFHVALLGFGVMGVIEMAQMVNAMDLRLYRFPAIFTLIYGIAGLYADQLALDRLPYYALALACLTSLGARRPLEKALPEIGIALVSCGYLGMALIGLAYVFNLSGPSGDELGRWLVLFCILTVWAGDSAAYVVGSMLGRHKISPMVSPNKTVEGTLANLAGNFLAVWAVKAWFLEELSMLDVVVLALVFGVLGFLGDLIESAWKRGSGIKDSGTIFPGHGGVMDRIDSIFLTAPVFYVYMLYVYGGGCSI